MHIPPAMQYQLLLLAAAAFAVATAIERAARAAFPAAIPPEKGGWNGTSRQLAAGAGRTKED